MWAAVCDYLFYWCVYTLLNASISMEGGVRGVKGQRNSSEVGRDGVTIPPSNHRQSSRCGWFVISVACKNFWGKDEGTTKQKKDRAKIMQLFHPLSEVKVICVVGLSFRLLMFLQKMQNLVSNPFKLLYILQDLTHVNVKC